MSEHIVAKHTRKIFKVWGNPSHGLKHKIGEVLIEIGIIVFAITLSLYLERWREHQHDREIEKQFLLGLKADLANDMQQQQADSAAYTNLQYGWALFRKAGLEKRIIPKDTIRLYINSMYGTIKFIPNDSRFEALKSSGELGVIEDRVLQAKILDLYQFRIRNLLFGTDNFSILLENHLIPFMIEKTRIQANGTSNINEMFQDPQMQNFLQYGNGVQGIIERYHAVIQQSQVIIGMIDQQYPAADRE